MKRDRAPFIRAIGVAFTLPLLTARPVNAQQAQPNTTPAAQSPATATATTTVTAPTDIPATSATVPVERAVAVEAVGRDRRLRAVRDACRAARGVDVLGIVATPTLAIAGVSLAYVGFTTPPPERTPTTFFLNAFGPGLVLGAIGVPLGRGMISAGDPMRHACNDVLEHSTVEERDLLALEGLIHAYGASASPLLMILLGAATAATAGGVALAFALQNRDLAQAMGGIAAAVVAGWAIVPPTPAQRATVRYYRGEFNPVTPVVALIPSTSHSSNTMLMLGVSGSF